MPATYRCAACNSTWNTNREPAECPNCASRAVDPRGHSKAEIDDFYQPPTATYATSTPVSSKAFGVCYWLGYLGIAVGYVALLAAADAEDESAISAVAMILVGVSFLIAAFIQANVKIYRGWKLIQPLRHLDRSEVGMNTPGVAAGLLWVPLFNLVWNFFAIHGLATRANKYMLRAGVDAQPMNKGLALACCILFACTIIPCFGGLAALPNVVIYHLVILDIDRMRGAIQEWQAASSEVEFLDDFDGP